MQLSTPLTCRRRELDMHRLAPDVRIIPFLQQAGLYGISRVGFFHLDWHLITALVERWRPETHTFHLPIGEATITLEDVAIQVGLPVDGRALTGSTDADWIALCGELLGVVPDGTNIIGMRLNLNWLMDHFSIPPDNADDVTLIRYARAYMLQLLGGCLFSNKSGNRVHLMFLPFLRDFEEAGRYS